MSEPEYTHTVYKSGWSLSTEEFKALQRKTGLTEHELYAAICNTPGDLREETFGVHKSPLRAIGHGFEEVGHG